MSEIAISVSNLSKCYIISSGQRYQILSSIIGHKTLRGKEFWSLRDINFEVARGDAVGIIGRNGSGKSTLLEIITGTLIPTSGIVFTSGRVAALLELGSGFNPEYTGSENIYLNGLLLGLSRREIEEKFDAIAGFADIGDFLSQPVKTYSSGMLARLAFSVQIALNPDILIVDEALSVGDFFFQQKCFGYLKKMRNDGLTLLFVSHDLGAVRNLCSKALYLKLGAIKFYGEANSAANQYLAEDYFEGEKKILNNSNINKNNQDIEAIKKSSMWCVSSSVQEYKTILAVILKDSNLSPITQIKMNAPLSVEIYFRNHPDEQGIISFIIKDRYDQISSAIRTHFSDIINKIELNSDYCVLKLDLIMALEAGYYSLKVVYKNQNHNDEMITTDETDWFGPLEICWDYNTHEPPFLGRFGLPVIQKQIRNI